MYKQGYILKRYSRERSCLEEGALLLLGLDRLRAENCADSLVEYVLQTLLRERGALEVLHGTNFLGHLETLLVGDGGKLLLTETLESLLVLAQIHLRAGENDRRVGAMVADFGEPLHKETRERKQKYANGQTKRHESLERNTPLHGRSRKRRG